MINRALRPLVLILLLCGGCDYERFNMIVGRDFYIGHIMTDFHGVAIADRKIVMTPGSRLAIETSDITQSVAQLDINILAGDGLVAYVRTVPHAFDTLRGISLRYSQSGCWARTEDSIIVPIEYNADAGPQTLKFYNDGDLVRFDAGCRLLYEQTTKLAATEYLILETLPGSSVEITAVKFFNGEEL